MKHYFVYIFLIGYCITGMAQQVKVDSANIAFKAKLMTMYRQGITDSTKLIKTIQSQKIEFTKNTSENIVLMKIYFDQIVYSKDNTTHSWFGNCNYYLAYNLKKEKFYRIGGFDSNDVVEFIDDIQEYSFSTEDELFLFNLETFGDFDMSCLMSYYYMSEKKRKRKGYKCFDRCSEVIFTEWKNMITDKKQNKH